MFWDQGENFFFDEKKIQKCLEIYYFLKILAFSEKMPIVSKF